MSLATFDDLLHAAHQQPIPQRLLCLFARAELPPDATAHQRAEFASGQGGFLVPQMTVDKALEQVSSFAHLRAEADGVSPGWQLVFVGVLHNPQAQPLSDDQVDAALERMTADVHLGQLAAYVPFNRRGDAVRLR